MNFVYNLLYQVFVLLRNIIAIIDNNNPKNIRIDGISEYNINPKINAARGSEPDKNIDETPESIQFKLTVERMQGSANENVESIVKNIIVKIGLIETKLVIWPKLVNGINEIEIKIIE